MTEINKSLNHMNNIGPEEYPDGDIYIDENAFDGFEGQTINITENSGGESDIEAGIEFIYNMREHTVDIAIATIYGLVVYAIVLWLTKKFKR